MIHINLTATRYPRLADPEPLPEATEDARSAFLCGWWNGICMGTVIGFGAAVMLLKALGWVAA